jgi:hypothetical protein
VTRVKSRPVPSLSQNTLAIDPASVPKKSSFRSALPSNTSNYKTKRLFKTPAVAHLPVHMSRRAASDAACSLQRHQNEFNNHKDGPCTCSQDVEEQPMR